jgi:DNA replication licensing factor MCM7
VCSAAAAFQDFLKSFKSTRTTEAATRDALSNLQVDDNEEEMQETPRRRGKKAQRAPRRQRQPDPELKPKYMEYLQKIANRERSSVIIELEDLKEVR